MKLIDRLKNNLAYYQEKFNKEDNPDRQLEYTGRMAGMSNAISIVESHNEWQSPDTKPPSEQFVQAMRNGVWGVARYDERFNYWIFRSPQQHFYSPVDSVDKWKFIDEEPHDKPSD